MYYLTSSNLVVVQKWTIPVVVANMALRQLYFSSLLQQHLTKIA